MGLMDYERVNKLMEKAHEFFVAAWNGDVNAIHPSFFILKRIYKEVSGALSKEKKDGYDKRFDEIFVIIQSWTKKNKTRRNPPIPYKTILKPLDELEDDILKERYRIMGFTVTKHISRERKIRRGLGV